MKKTSVGRKSFLIFNYLFLAAVCLTCVLPFVNLLAVSFSGNTAVAAGKVTFWPVDFTTFSYEYALRGGKFLRALLISIELVILGTGVNVLLMVLTAYPLSRGKDRLLGRNLYMAYFVLTMLIGGGLIPTYLVVVKAGLKNSIWSLILPGALPVYNMVILMNFIRQLPEELAEAARIDGASEWKVLLKVVLPLSKPALATVGLFCIVGHWNNWFGGIIYMSETERYPLQTYMQSLLQNFEAMMKLSGTDYALLLSQMNAQTGRAAQLFLGAIPVMLVYPFLQKYFTTGLTLGSVKG
ncbi:MAG TPA: carbohydrate ABC transporter permease [Candidatus Eisenbergiella pullicola]|nr:carbohydrate ABC transporter permease [Candidatus Eisenbergiella pullicola]